MVTCDGVMVLFGGWNGQAFFDDLVLLHSHGTVWSTVAAVAGTMRPSARMGHSASVNKNSMFVFGGFLHPFTLSDFWEYNLATSTWSQISVPGSPPDRYRHSTVVIDQYLFLFGGVNAVKQRFDDLWCFDIGRGLWSKIETPDLSLPKPRCLHQAVSLEGAMYVFGGVGEGGKKLGDTYRLVTPFFSPPTAPAIEDLPLQWTERVGRPQLLDARTGHVTFVYDSVFYVFGGSGVEGFFTNSLFSLNLMTLMWQQEFCVGEPPPPVSSGKAVLVDNSVFLFGGVDERKIIYSQNLYHLSIPGKRWSRVSPASNGPSPTGRVDHTFTLLGQELVVFGGLHRKEVLNDVWTFSLADRVWNALRPGSRPPARFGHTAAPYNQQLIVFGGWDGGKLLGDLWILEPSKGWKNLTLQHGPCPRYRHTAATISDQYMCIFGGVGEDQKKLNDLYLLDMGRMVWSSVNVLGGKIPTARTFHEASTVGEDRMIVYGGRDQAGNKLGDVWTISFSTADSIFCVNEQQALIEKLRRRITYLESKVVCKVCMEKEINVVLIPCAHRCLCLACASVIVNGECICPICRETIVRLVETIDA
jgi:N-acetylneuraminic acid mutarotase